MIAAAPFAIAAVTAPPKPRPIGPGDPMPFGKHKGQPIETIPQDYLAWCLREMDACKPDSDRYWPEFKAALESVAGPMLPGMTRPTVMAFPALCSVLAARGITISVRGGELVTSETITDEAIREAVRVHKAPLLAVVKLVEPGQVASRGSAKLIVAAEVRCLIKAWYGRMSKRLHPDAGGSTAAQVAVNQCYQDLMKVFTEWEGTK